MAILHFVDNIKNSVLEKITPTKEEEDKINSFVDEIKRIGKTVSGLDCIVCGSIGKFTWLKGDHDIDIFMLFPKSVSRQDLEGRGLEYGRKIAKELKGKFMIKYAEHPYVRIFANGFIVDVVPCYRTKKGEDIKSAVDRSPHHMRYVLENLSPVRRNDARLLKQFCKGIEVYGSDTKNMGFSGYICELLVIKHGSFEDVLKNASRWKIPVSIDIESSGKRKFQEPIAIIDPTDAKRNAAANVSVENLVKFIVKSKDFLNDPDEKYFSISSSKPLTTKELKKLEERNTKFVAVFMKRPDIIDDTLYPQLRRALRRVEGNLGHNDFSVLRSFEYAGDKKMLMIFELDVWKLPKIKKMTGPVVFSRKHSEEFLSKYAGNFVYVEDVSWVSEKLREFGEASDLVNSMKNEKDLESHGIPGNIAPHFSNGTVIEDKSFWKVVKKEKDLSGFLRKKYFESLV